MEKVDLTFFDMKPEAMVNYLRYNGPHFSENLAKFAIDKMKKNGKKLDPVSQEQLTQFLKNANVKVDNDQLFDAWYVINMAKADYYGSSITSDAHLAKFVKDYLDDEDGYDGIAFNRFIADCARKGIVINWVTML